MSASAVRKVRALLRLADPERNATAAERDAARAKAEALAAKHGIALDALAGLPDDRELGEHDVGIDGPHQGWATLLLMDIAAAFGVSVRLTRDGATLAGPADDVARTVRAHAEAWQSVRAGHDALTTSLTPQARGARRYLHARFPDPVYHADVIGHLRYWPAGKLERDIVSVLATSRGRARAIAHAIRNANIAPADVAPTDAISRGYFDAATYAIYTRLRDLQRARGRVARVEEPLSEDPAPPAMPPPAAPSPRRRRAPKPPPAVAVTAGSAAGSSSPIGLFGIDDAQIAA